MSLSRVAGYNMLVPPRTRRSGGRENTAIIVLAQAEASFGEARVTKNYTIYYFKVKIIATVHFLLARTKESEVRVLQHEGFTSGPNLSSRGVPGQELV
jgi:hypothetical protein